MSHRSPSLRIAVLSIDPSSHLTGGSILGDKTRMQWLAAHPSAYIRPSASKGGLGGTHRNTFEAIRLCELAGYDLIIVETVGVGQNEISVRMLVDVLLLLVSPTGGDELQGMKKGIVEVADLVVVNKAEAEGEVRAAANATKSDYTQAIQLLHMIQGRSLDYSIENDYWVPVVELCSSLEPTHEKDSGTQRQIAYSTAAKKGERKEKATAAATAAADKATSLPPAPSSSSSSSSPFSSPSFSTRKPPSRPPSVASIWSIIERWLSWSSHSNRLARLRASQLSSNFWQMMTDEIIYRVKFAEEEGYQEVKEEMKRMEAEMKQERVMPRVAAQRVIDELLKGSRSKRSGSSPPPSSS